MIDNRHPPAGHRPRRLFQALVPLLALSVRALAEGIDLPDLPAPETWREIFAYCQEVSAEFGADGVPVAVRRSAEPPTPLPPDAPPPPPFDPDADAARLASGGDEQREKAFLSWLKEEYSEPGETVLVAGTDPGGVFVLSEHDDDARALKRYDMASNRAEWLTPPDAPRELVGPVFFPAPDGSSRLAGLVWNGPEGARTEWLDPALAAAGARLEEAFPGTGFDWLIPDASGTHWIVRARRPDRPPAWLCVDVSALSWQVLAECPAPISPTVRTLFRWNASDGAALCGVYTRPDAPGPFPLVVFPHGGPGALSTTDFDERVWALADAGFAVFQPNYRGSSGLGKPFRLDGWGPAGIRRALLDIREGAAALLADPSANLLPAPPVLLGGSWGGYLALAELAFFPGDWSGAVSFFGAFDLPALLRDELARVAAELSPAEAARARLSLLRQFGDPDSPSGMAALAGLSPALHPGAIRAPVLLFHNRADRVIPFAQSVRMADALSALPVPFLFRAADGGHGWSPVREADLYAALAALFHTWVPAARPASPVASPAPQSASGGTSSVPDGGFRRKPLSSTWSTRASSSSGVCRSFRCAANSRIPR